MANKTFSFSVGLGEGRIPASQMKNMKFHYTPIPFDLKEIEDFTKEIGQVVQHEYGLNNVNMSIKYGFFEDWGKTAKNSRGSANKTAGKYISTEKRLDVYMDSIWGKTLNRYGANPTIDQFKEEISNVVAHELRHQWQFENKEGAASDLWKQQDEYVDSLANKYSSINQLTRNDYLNHPIEIDARDYGDKIQATYKEKINNYRNMMNSTVTSEKSKQRKLKNANKSYRPNITMNGNSLDIDSIYNYSIPKKVKGDVPEFDTDNAQDLLNNVKNFFNDNIENTSKPTNTPNRLTPEEILSPDYELRAEPTTVNSAMDDPLSWTDDYILNTATDEATLNDMINQRDQAMRFKDINPDKPGTWTEEYINKTAKTPDELHDMTQRMREAKNLDTVETINQQRKAEDVPKNRQQKRQEAKEGKGQGKKQGKKSKQQKAREKRQQQFEARQKALGRDPEEVKNLNKEMNEKRKQQGKETREKKKLDAEKAKADKANAEKAYQEAMDKINGKTDLERMEFYNTTETERKYKFQQENQESLESLTENKGQVNDSNKYVHNQNFDDIDADINATQENINRGYKDVNGYTGNKLNSEMDNYFDGRTIYDTSVPRPERTIEEISEGFDSYRGNSKYVDDAGNLVKTRKVTKTFGPNPLENVSKVGVFTTGMNILGTVSDYKDERRKGHGVVSSAVRAGAKFAMYEALGLWAIPVALVSNAPGAIIKGADALYKENRKMNSAANFEAFGGAQFMDTQQLATMRQSGMEMAKMSQYNLQQTLMGNEATYLHR